MRTVIERHGHYIDDAGYIHHDDEPTTYEHAEQICGHRLDRRKNYAIIEGIVCELVNWTGPCSGCYESVGFCDRGTGCEECGYHGKVRRGQWVPIGAIDAGEEED